MQTEALSQASDAARIPLTDGERHDDLILIKRCAEVTRARLRASSISITRASDASPVSISPIGLSRTRWCRTPGSA